MNLNKTSLINKVAEVEGITKVQAEKEVQHVLNGIVNCLEEISGGEGKLQILNYFTMDVKYKKEHEAKNPKTREIVKVPGGYKIKFKPGKLLNETINQ